MTPQKFYMITHILIPLKYILFMMFVHRTFIRQLHPHVITNWETKWRIWTNLQIGVQGTTYCLIPVKLWSQFLIVDQQIKRQTSPVYISVAEAEHMTGFVLQLSVVILGSFSGIYKLYHLYHQEEILRRFCSISSYFLRFLRTPNTVPIFHWWGNKLILVTKHIK